MNKAVFLDRDGTIIAERGDYNFHPDHIEINEGAIETLMSFRKKGYLIIVITNQGGIAKGLYKASDVTLIHNIIYDFFNDYGIKIHDFFYCPHHPDFTLCLCRKPNSLMLEKAIAMYNIDKKASYMIGDSERDIEAAINAGIKGIKIEPNQDLSEIIEEVS